MNFYGVWYGCAKGAQIINGQLVQDTPPSKEDVDAWIQTLPTSMEVINDVRHRYVLTKGSFRTFNSWARKQFFFRNATPKQIEECGRIVLG